MGKPENEDDFEFDKPKPKRKQSKAKGNLRLLTIAVQEHTRRLAALEERVDALQRDIHEEFRDVETGLETVKKKLTKLYEKRTTKPG